jgi:hypothetical protein
MSNSTDRFHFDFWYDIEKIAQQYTHDLSMMLDTQNSLCHEYFPLKSLLAYL